MDSQKRLLLALGLSFAVTTVYVLFFSPTPPAPGADVHDAGVTAVTVPAPASMPSPAPFEASAPGNEAPPAREVTLRRAAARYTFTSAGGVLSSAVLEERKTREQRQVSLREGWSRLFGKTTGTPPPMNLAMPPPSGPGPLAVALAGEHAFPANARYAITEDGPSRLIFRAEQNGWEVVKTVEWPEAGHELVLGVRIRNLSREPRTAELQLFYTRSIDPKGEEAPSYFGGVGNQASSVCRVGNDMHKRTPSDKPPDEYKGALRFIGVDHQYFLSAIFPLGPTPEGRCVIESTATERKAMAALPITLGPGEMAIQSFGAYLGPKAMDELTQVPTAGVVALAKNLGIGAPASPELEKSVDFGIWAVICKVLLFFLNFFHGWARNWGVAIILLTLVVKLVLLPLTHRSMVGMEAMKRLQPRMEDIRKRFPDDRERQNMETMKMYQEAKVNPFGSCLLMLVQMPVWFALYTTLRTSYELYNEAFLSPVWTDLTYKDPTYVLPVVLGATMIITSKLQPPSADPVQARMLTYVMPVMFTFLLLNTPAGLTLYMVTNNLLSIAQTYALRRWLKTHPEPAK